MLKIILFVTYLRASHGLAPDFVIPKECKAGVVVNKGPYFELKVEIVPVPEPGQ
jgi:alcohol dehydrogenase, propanol-preferring